MRLSKSTAFVLVLVWLVCALAFDRLVLAPTCALCTDVLALSFELTVPAIPGLKFPHVGVLVLVGIPMLATALVLIPWTKPLSDKEIWLSAVRAWCKPFVWLLIALALTIAGETLYLILSQLIPEGAKKLLEAFSLKIVLSIRGEDFLPVQASLTGLFGLVFGTYLFLDKGIRGLVDAIFHDSE